MRFLSLVLFCIILFPSFSQIKKGVVKYDLIYHGVDDPSVETMFQDAYMKLSFMPGKAHLELNFGLLGVITTITDEKSSKSLVMTEMMGHKIAVWTDVETNQKEIENNQNEVQLVDGQKEIAGYTCKKAIVTDKEGNELEVWYTDQVSVYTKGQTVFDSKIPGFPMYIQTYQNGVVIEFTVSEIETKVKKKIFKMIVPNGFEIKTMDQINNSN